MQRDIIAISVSGQLSVRGFLWKLKAVLALPSTLPPPLRWDPQEHFDYFKLELPPPEPNRAGRTAAERDAIDRATSVTIGQAFAAELGVPCFVDPPEGVWPILSWLYQLQSRTLVALLEKARRILVVSGRWFAPTQATGSVKLADLLASDEARLRHWTEKLKAVDEVEAWARTLHEHPYRGRFGVLKELDRQGRLLGVIDETPFSHLQACGLRDDAIVAIHGTLAEVECLTCGSRAPSAPAIAAFRTTGAVPLCPCGAPQKFAVTAFGQAPATAAVERAKQLAATCDLVLVLGSALSTRPCNAIAVHPVQTRAVPLILLGFEETKHDQDATLIIGDTPDDVLAFAMKSPTAD